jgi:uncharacterized membrane protein
MKPTHRDGILRGGMALLIRLLILSAAGISAYLLSVSLRGGTAVGCAPGSACDAVLQSRWAYVFGMPVSALALIVYLALLVATFSLGAKTTPKQRRGSWEIVVLGALLVLGAALWFMGVQAFVLRQFCPWCMTAHACGAAAAILLFTRVPVTCARDLRDKDPSVSRSTLRRVGVICAVLIAVLGVAQALSQRKTHTITNLPAFTNAVASAPTSTPGVTASPTQLISQATTNTGAAAPVVPAKVASTPTLASSARTFDVFGGRFRLDLTQVPVWGSIDAPFKLLSLYDYTCHHCRDMHSRVVEVKRRFGDKLAVVSLPMPLDAQCNTLMRQTPPAHRNACVYAKLGLIVWRAKHEAIEPFDVWLFGFQNPPPLIVVTNKAVELVGASAFDLASRDPSLDEKLSTSIAIYGVSGREFKNPNMPQFMIGTNIVSGTLTTEELRNVVAKYVGP